MLSAEHVIWVKVSCPAFCPLLGLVLALSIATKIVSPETTVMEPPVEEEWASPPARPSPPLLVAVLPPNIELKDTVTSPPAVMVIEPPVEVEWREFPPARPIPP